MLADGADPPRSGGSPRRVLLVYGTRPEAIKLAPVAAALADDPGLAPVVCTTAQHRQMVDQAQDVFGLRPDIDLDLMTEGQHPDELTARVLGAMRGVLADLSPDVLLVQGDTTTAMAAALSGFHAGVEVAHVEAGLRTGDLARPFPEEANRRIIDTLAGWLFAPTERARAALEAEGHEPGRVLLTGNTVVDALRLLPGSGDPVARGQEVLVTLHRRESHGPVLAGICRAIAGLAADYPRMRWTLPVHPNPAVRTTVRRILGAVPNVRLTEPLDYPEMVAAIRRSTLVLTDSGGIQEEAPTFGTPVLVLRETTERPEGVEAGVARLVGTDPDALAAAARELLDDPGAWAAMSRAANPYGDGYAALRIADALAGRKVTPWEPEAVQFLGSWL
jgi:UDP-N-acetylglucosamine 2-epimerase (non-hydrolysing)